MPFAGCVSLNSPLNPKEDSKSFGFHYPRFVQESVMSEKPQSQLHQLWILPVKPYGSDGDIDRTQKSKGNMPIISFSAKLFFLILFSFCSNALEKSQTLLCPSDFKRLFLANITLPLFL